MRVDSLHILVIDDSAMTRTVVKQCLVNFGTYNIYEAENGMAGFEMVATCRPDVILCDLSMEPMNGFEFVELLRRQKNRDLRNTPVIILTSHGEQSHVERATGLNIQGYLLKPISPKLLIERITQVMNQADAS